MPLLILIFIAIGLLMVALAIPMIRGRVPPNAWYGFRINETLDNPHVWYPANAYAGRLLRTYGWITVAASLLLALIPDLSEDAYSLLMSAILLIGIVILLILSVRYARRLAAEQPPFGPEN